ncbi:MAG: GNAT family N-acetyltransferase [Candidatus Cohnella colombiensis]|uniref:GNAT family N-acetyltransferase n=1 Tax=Candidatus Cohnella colombiensis TaxID=3121368 RepID=A0AA95EYL7_9BACL|nr:MAG: GNAT family N-acetyltransferase [Cohnella sp.]
MDMDKVKTREQLEQAFQIRKTVFVVEQGVAEEIEIDQYEDIANHVLVYDGEKPVGTGRVRFIDQNQIAKLERICVLPEYRKLHFGEKIMQALEQIAKESGVLKAKLHAQTHAAPFYEKQGYITSSEVFMEENIPHVLMIKQL